MYLIEYFWIDVRWLLTHDSLIALSQCPDGAVLSLASGFRGRRRLRDTFDWQMHGRPASSPPHRTTHIKRQERVAQGGGDLGRVTSYLQKPERPVVTSGERHPNRI